MSLVLQLVFATFCIISSIYADVSHILDHHETTTPQPPLRPYVFSYSAGRTPDTIDRTHTEVSNGNIVRGKFSYIDPNNEVRTVQYTADKNGFHPQLSHAVVDTEANQRATANHLKLYKEIAEAHNQGDQSIVTASLHDSEAVKLAKKKHFTLFQRIAEEHAQIGAAREAERLAFEATSEHNQIN